jgi:hypothetical protein
VSRSSAWMVASSIEPMRRMGISPDSITPPSSE